jgi:hypothetical protein
MTSKSEEKEYKVELNRSAILASVCKRAFRSPESDFRERYIIQKTSITIKKQEMRDTAQSDVSRKVSNNLTFFCCLKNQKNVDVQKSSSLVTSSSSIQMFKHGKNLFDEISYNDRYVNKQINPFDTTFKQNKSLFTKNNPVQKSTNPFD